MTKTILTYGTFDTLHFEHIDLLRRAKDLNPDSRLIVGLSTDEFNDEKGKLSYHNFTQRRQMLEAVKYIDIIIKEKSWDQKVEDVKKYKADIFVMGDDWKGKFDFLSDYCEVVYLPRTPDISSSAIKKAIK